MKTVTEFLNTVGRQDFRASTGIPEQSLTRAISDNLMPAAWFRDVRDFCTERGIEVPEGLFRWSDKRKSASHNSFKGASDAQ